MQQDSNFSYIAPEDPSDPPQLAFPEPGQSSEIPAQSTIPSMPALSVAPDALQLPFPNQAVNEYASTQIPFPQPLPSTETIDTTQIRSTQPSSSEADYQASRPMPGLVEIPFTTQAMPAVEPTTKEQEDNQPLAPSNQDAKRAIINGVISLVVSIFTLTTVAGLAALVIGIFAITYGLLGLRLARRLPNGTGRGQAIIGIALGLIAWSIVIAAFILRAPQSS